MIKTNIRRFGKKLLKALWEKQYPVYGLIYVQDEDLNLDNFLLYTTRYTRSSTLSSYVELNELLKSVDLGEEPEVQKIILVDEEDQNFERLKNVLLKTYIERPITNVGVSNVIFDAGYVFYLINLPKEALKQGIPRDENGAFKGDMLYADFNSFLDEGKIGEAQTKFCLSVGYLAPEELEMSEHWTRRIRRRQRLFNLCLKARLYYLKQFAESVNLNRATESFLVHLYDHCQARKVDLYAIPEDVLSFIILSKFTKLIGQDGLRDCGFRQELEEELHEILFELSDDVHN